MPGILFKRHLSKIKCLIEIEEDGEESLQGRDKGSNRCIFRVCRDKNSSSLFLVVTAVFLQTWKKLMMTIVLLKEITIIFAAPVVGHFAHIMSFLKKPQQL